MNKTVDNLTIMFADITGSTSLYDTHGNDIAESIVSESITQASNCVTDNNGSVVKTIGDEIMCSFEKSEHALDASACIHNYFKDNLILSKYPVAFRIGVHSGECVMSKNDYFGDAVNIAARLAAIARGQQTIFSDAAYEQSDIEHKNNSRKYDVTNLKGKESKIVIYELLWEDNQDDELTRISAHLTSVHSFQETSSINEELTLTYEDKTIRQTGTDQGTISIGRSIDNKLPVVSTMASRAHAKITYRRNKFILTDQSTNGTTVINGNAHPVFIKREEIHLLENGFIIFGQCKHGDAQSQDRIEFNISTKENKF